MRDLKEENIEDFIKFLRFSANWDQVYLASDTNNAFDMFYDTLLSAFYKFCPLIKVRNGRTNSKPKWLTPGIRKSCETKRELFTRLKQTRDKDSSKKHYKTFCTILHRVISSAKRKENEARILN